MVGGPLNREGEVMVAKNDRDSVSTFTLEVAPLLVERCKKLGKKMRLSQCGKFAYLLCPIDGHTVIATFSSRITVTDHR